MSKPYRSQAPLGLYRDPEWAVIFGVCAGLAGRIGVNPWGVRVLFLIGLVLFTWPTVIAYLTAALLLPRRGLIWRGGREERDFWRTAARDGLE
ncbi:PspC domain-containing protein [Gammaproteobacteria bacterium AB-CW1]|uniref:PspC domain-containing protein n=1 Tax=Natronospira elongata TaxID=3110268 RepID=A0AAP6JEP2_9GAMM|nr:PspC domain-containing protein [Gammaproteobacteria bacterium AB-CW1]